MNIENLFSIPFVTEKINLNNQELEFILNYISSDDNLTLNHGSGNYYSKDSYILKKLPDLYNQINILIEKYTTLVLGSKNSLKITQSWINNNPPSSIHHTHSHSNSIVSGVIYIQTNELTGDFHVYRPLNRLESFIRGEISFWQEYNFESMYYKPKINDIYLFPSSLQHSVDTNLSEITRISLSFNTFYKLPFGDIRNLTKVD
jgi:uncharacterized protein (TIGR02466 family)